jgi:UDP-N-acetylmuramate dehydrogenase
MNSMSASGDFVKRDELLAPHTTFGIGGRADYFARPRTEDELRAVVYAAQQNRLPVFLLGGGSNLLVSDLGVRGVVVRLDQGWFSVSSVSGNRMRFGAGVPLPGLVMTAARMGLDGVVGLAGIPGSAGGALVMNAGGRLGSIGDAVARVRIMDWTGAVRDLSAAECRFEYRGSALQEFIVIEGEFELKRGDPAQIVKRSREFLREKVSSQPYSERSAGCVFKNPPGDSAGRLIDELGLKGWTIGPAMVSDQHANFIVNLGGAKAAHVIALATLVRRRVQRAYGVLLGYEIKLWDESPAAARDAARAA